MQVRGRRVPLFADAVRGDDAQEALVEDVYVGGALGREDLHGVPRLLRGMGDGAYTERLRVAGNVQPGSIRRSGTNANFVLVETEQTLNVVYNGTEPPPDTFKDDAQALAEGSFSRDGVFYAKQIQAKCASKYAPQQGTAATTSSTVSN